MRKRSLHVLAFAAALLLGLGAYLLLPAQVAQERLRTQAYIHGVGALPCTINWEKLESVNADMRAWIRIESCSVDCPVVCPKPDDPNFYLEHNFWEESSVFGCPFLAEDIDPNGMCVLAYGHHINWSKESFSGLFDCWKQEHFDALGTCIWTTKQNCEQRLEPLCSLLSNCWDQELQELTIQSPSELHSTLTRLCQRAHARAPNWEQLCSSSTRMLKLITCASAIPGQDARTCVVFVG